VAINAPEGSPVAVALSEAAALGVDRGESDTSGLPVARSLPWGVDEAHVVADEEALDEMVSREEGVGAEELDVTTELDAVKVMIDDGEWLMDGSDDELWAPEAE
jgi:hypothetical protein